MSMPVQISIPSEPKYLCLIRGVLRNFLDCTGIPEEMHSKIILCIDEACSNVIKHSYEGKPDGPIEISLEFENSQFTVKIRDYGKQCDTQKFKPRCLEEVRPGGLGTHFMYELMDSVSFCTDRECGTLLVMSKKLGEPLEIVSQKQELKD